MKRTASIFCAALVSTSAAFAWKWADEPQPLLRYERTSVSAGALRGRAPVTSAAGAPLAWDQSARILWSISGNSLSAEIWNGSMFIQVAVNTVEVDRNGGLLVDSGLHFLFYLDPRGLPQCAKRAGRSWAGSTMGEEPLTRLLAVDARRHTVFGYDADARGIRLYRYDARARTWSSSVIATGLGAAGDAGVVDNTGPILYSEFEDKEPVPIGFSNAPLSGFRPEPDPKWKSSGDGGLGGDGVLTNLGLALIRSESTFGGL